MYKYASIPGLVVKKTYLRIAVQIVTRSKFHANKTCINKC